MAESDVEIANMALTLLGQSHIASLANLLLYSSEVQSHFEIRGELNYLSHIVFKVYRDSVDILLSTGAEHDIFGHLTDQDTVVPIQMAKPIKRGVSHINIATVALPFEIREKLASFDKNFRVKKYEEEFY